MDSRKLLQPTGMFSELAIIESFLVLQIIITFICIWTLKFVVVNPTLFFIALWK